MDKQFKQLSYDLKDLDEKQGVVVAYANAYHNEDSDGASPRHALPAPGFHFFVATRSVHPDPQQNTVKRTIPPLWGRISNQGPTRGFTSLLRYSDERGTAGNCPNPE